MSRASARLICMLLVSLLFWRTWAYFAIAIQAVGYPYELDYGEGIVWQQAALMFTPSAYGTIDTFPFVVFHYTPVYHFVVRAVVAVLGMDTLAAGRLVSISSLLACCLVVGALASRFASGATTSERRLVAIVSSQLALCLYPVISWSVNMRVDMLAHALSLLGVWCGIRAMRQPWMIFAASAAFLLAVFTKQNSIAAPLALFAVLYAHRPRLAVVGLSVCAASGAAALGAGYLLTEGRFLDHIFRYNVNRWSESQIAILAYVARVTLPFLFAAVISLPMLKRRIPANDERGTHSGNDRVDNPVDEFVPAKAIRWYAATATVMLFGAFKIGASSNYTIEVLLALCVVAGAGLAPVVSSALARASNERINVNQLVPMFAVPLLILSQAAFEPQIRSGPMRDRVTTSGMDSLVVQIARSAAPVVSDDMVLIMRAGKRVEIEPAIATELASVGIWDDTAFLRRIERREFAMFITEGGPGDTDFDFRYTPRVAAALMRQYPVVERRAGYMVRTPLVRASGGRD